jgi:alkylated DNA repair dioxygenase AlkB
MFGKLSISDYYDELASVSWQEVKGKEGVTRYSAWYVVDGCSCSYSYGRFGSSWQANNFPQWLVTLTCLVASIVGVCPSSLNSANLNKYGADSHNLYWHSDDEKLFRESEMKRNVDIFSLSFGASRTMAFRRKYHDKVREVELCDGDLCAMLGRVQDFYQHCIKPANEEQRQSPYNFRYNITWRMIKRHAKGCQLRS